MPPLSFASAMAPIVVPYLAYSIDSIITAVGFTLHVRIVVIAVVVTVLVMLVAATPLANIERSGPSGTTPQTGWQRRRRSLTAAGRCGSMEG